MASFVERALTENPEELNKRAAAIKQQELRAKAAELRKKHVDDKIAEETENARLEQIRREKAVERHEKRTLIEDRYAERVVTLERETLELDISRKIEELIKVSDSWATVEDGVYKRNEAKDELAQNEIKRLLNELNRTLACKTVAAKHELNVSWEP